MAADERDARRDQDGDQGAWRDLVARFELPVALDPALPPWPDPENLNPAAPWPAEASQPESEATRGDDVVGQPTTGKYTNQPDEPGPGDKSDPRSDSASRARTPAIRARVVKPASGIPPATDQARGWNLAALAGHASGVPAGSDPGEAIEHHDLGGLGLDDEDENSDDRYVPPHVPPLPRIDPVARGAWTALFGGPGYLLIATALSWQIPGLAVLAAVIAFIAGFVVLVSRLGDGPSRRDGPDQGAVV
jgi:hypothetical protein